MIPVQIIDRNSATFRTNLPTLPRPGDYLEFASSGGGASRVVVVEVVFYFVDNVFQFVNVQVG